MARDQLPAPGQRCSGRESSGRRGIQAAIWYSLIAFLASFGNILVHRRAMLRAIQIEDFDGSIMLLLRLQVLLLVIPLGMIVFLSERRAIPPQSTDTFTDRTLPAVLYSLYTWCLLSLIGGLLNYYFGPNAFRSSTTNLMSNDFSLMATTLIFSCGVFLHRFFRLSSRGRNDESIFHPGQEESNARGVRMALWYFSIGLTTAIAACCVHRRPIFEEIAHRDFSGAFVIMLRFLILTTVMPMSLIALLVHRRAIRPNSRYPFYAGIGQAYLYFMFTFMTLTSIFGVVFYLALGDPSGSLSFFVICLMSASFAGVLGYLIYRPGYQQRKLNLNWRVLLADTAESRHFPLSSLLLLTVAAATFVGMLAQVKHDPDEIVNTSISGGICGFAIALTVSLFFQDKKRAIIYGCTAGAIAGALTLPLVFTPAEATGRSLFIAAIGSLFALAIGLTTQPKTFVATDE